MMKSTTHKTLLALMIGCLALAGGASAQPAGITFEVTVTNLTSGQIFSPPLVVSHTSDFQLFVPGQAASAELAMLAEDAISEPLVKILGADPDVFAIELGSDVIMPGASMTVTIQGNPEHRTFSVAGMLVTTNDALYAVQGLRAGRQDVASYAAAYDAGSEANNEDCAYIPGPPCGNPEVRTDTSEGFIHIHNGIHGLASLLPQLFDWRNPVAKISVRRVQ